MADATKIYSGPITALGIAAADTGDDGSYTDLGYLSEESGAEISWEPLNTVLSDGNQFMCKGRGTAKFRLVQTDPSGIQSTLETYKTALAKFKITTPDTTDEYYFIDDVFVTFGQARNFKGGEVHYLEVTVSRITDNPDDFCNGPKAAS